MSRDTLVNPLPPPYVIWWHCCNPLYSVTYYLNGPLLQPIVSCQVIAVCYVPSLTQGFSTGILRNPKKILKQFCDNKKRKFDVKTRKWYMFHVKVSSKNVTMLKRCSVSVKRLRSNALTFHLDAFFRSKITKLHNTVNLCYCS